ncbi:Multidrug and toxin extrusion protein 1 [Lamellibrachia satsuma]|nr:Multidrug and toxin extrusion protein 1 [Lamellibrachia satsuma]
MKSLFPLALTSKEWRDSGRDHYYTRFRLNDSFWAGAKRLTRLIAVYVFLLALMPCIAVYINAASILLLIGQNPEVSRLAGRYLVIFIPGALSFFMYMILSKYLQTQVSRVHQPSRPVILADAHPSENIVIPNVIIGIVANSLNAGMHYVFLYQLHWNTDASALSQAVSHFVMFSLTLIYIRWSKIYEETWGGWTTESLQYWGKFVRISISGMTMVSLECWNFEIGTFLSGILGLTELGAVSIVLQVEDMVYEVVLGIQTAATILIGQKLGAQDKLGALTMARLVIVVLLIACIIPLTMYLVFRDQLPYIFTDIRREGKLAKIVAIAPLRPSRSRDDGGTATNIPAMKRAGGKVEVVPNIHDHVTDHYQNTTSITNTTQSVAVDSSVGLNEQDGPSVEPELETTVEEKTLDRVGTNGEAARKKTILSQIIAKTQSAAVERTPDLNEDDDLTAETMTLSTTQLIIRRGSILLLMSLIVGGGIAGHLLIPVQSSTFLQSFTNTTTAIPADNITL